MLWDIFCRVIDNLGDIGVSWRLSANLAQRGETVRLWVDDPSALHWMAPGACEGVWAGITVLPWHLAQDPKALATLTPADVWVEAFGCDVPAQWLSAFAGTTGPGHAVPTQQPVWINLEYLSAETYVERSHRLSSPVMSGPAKGWTKTFFYPGFTAKTGGLLRESALESAENPRKPAETKHWLRARQVDWRGERLISLFCYEPNPLANLLDQLACESAPTVLLVTAGRASAAVRALVSNALQIGTLRLHYLPHLTQVEFDELLQCSDINFVRGEDSVVRAIWAGKPFVWHIYPQEDGAHRVKLDAFLNLLNLPTSVRTFQHQWNSAPGEPAAPGSPNALPLRDLHLWDLAVVELRAKLLQMDDLATQLLQFVHKNR